MRRHNIRVVLQWIPAHTGIPGNERADALAKQGASLPQPDIPTDYATCRQMIRANLKEDWMNLWATGMTGRRMYDHITKSNDNDPFFVKLVHPKQIKMDEGGIALPFFKRL